MFLTLEIDVIIQGEGEQGNESKRYDWEYTYHKIGEFVTPVALIDVVC